MGWRWTGAILLILVANAACGRQHSERQDSNSAAYKAGAVAHRAANGAGKAAEIAARKLEEGARKAHEGWKEQGRIDREKKRDVVVHEP